MIELESKLISTAWRRTRIRVRWRIKHGWLARLLLRMPKWDELEADYVRDGEYWRTYPQRAPVHVSLALTLCEIEARLTAASSKEEAPQ